MIKLQGENTIIMDNSRVKKCHQYYSKLYKGEDTSLGKADEYLQNNTKEF